MIRRTVFRPITALVLAILLAAMAAAVYRGFVFAQFAPSRLEISGAELHSSGHVVTLALPDLSQLRGQAAVLGIRLRNFRAEPRHIGLLLDGLPNTRVIVPPGGTTRWDVVLPPALMQTVGGGAAVPRAVEVTGDADGWAVIGVDIRNYHRRLGERLAVVVPRRADTYTPAPAPLAIAIGLAFAALAGAFAPRHPSQSSRVTGWMLTLTACLVCATCLTLPRVSPYRLLLSPTAFLLVVAALFSPLLFSAPALLMSLAGFIAPRLAVAGHYWRRHQVTFERGAALLALCALGVAQPIFEVVSNSPEFFAARGTSPVTAIIGVLSVCLGIPFVMLGIERGLRAVNGWAALTFLSIALAGLSASVVMPWLRRAELVAWPWELAFSVLIGGVVAFVYSRGLLVRQFLTALAPAALVVPALFLLDPAVAQTFLPSESGGAMQTLERRPPIVLVVFDELPLNSLLDARANIDAERYPNFAALAREAYWFRNATTVSPETSYAVPAILSGRYPATPGAVPTLRYYPANLFALLARHYDIFASMRFRKLCPHRACETNSALPADSVRSLVSDLGLVWLHIILPQELTEGLPPVVGDWADFGQTHEAQTGGTRSGRAGVFARFLSSIDGHTARLHFIHSMLPHMAFEYVPSGLRYRAPDYQTKTEGGEPLFERASAAYADALQQRHLAQVGFVDRLVGDLMGRLREVGLYDQALVIITADHGASYREGVSRRQPQPQNLSDILHVPLFMKLPGQRHGEIVDRIVETVDILPTILDVLGAKGSPRMDGGSLIDRRTPERAIRTYIVRSRLDVESHAVGDLAANRAVSLDRKERRFGSGDLLTLYAAPAVRRLLGTSVNARRSRRARDVQVRMHDPGQFAAVRLDRNPLPLYVRGTVTTSRSAPVSVAVVVNGAVAAIAESYYDGDDHVFGTLIPEKSLRNGVNAIDAFAMDGAE